MWYISGGLILFCYWLAFFLSDRTTPKTHLMSWIVLLVASLLWPISAPLAILELLGKTQGGGGKPKAINTSYQDLN
jgi:hypothetical protein